ncbi:MAG TPA: HIT domain-containing protein [Myxococcota bacterium]|nr:HIT domain-containing protein [Myxococcota bacterium]
MNDCIFCKIVQGLIPSAKIYEDDDFLAFLDIRPANHGHVLIIPKVHAERVTDLPESILSRELVLAARIAAAVLAATGMTDFNLFNTNGAASGQEVFHHHLHVIPRKAGDGMKLSIDPQTYREGEMAEVAGAIRRRLDLREPGES